MDNRLHLHLTRENDDHIVWQDDGGGRYVVLSEIMYNMLADIVTAYRDEYGPARDIDEDVKHDRLPWQSPS